jgi:hypothetical protein
MHTERANECDRRESQRKSLSARLDERFLEFQESLQRLSRSRSVPSSIALRPFIASLSGNMQEVGRGTLRT